MSRSCAVCGSLRKTLLYRQHFSKMEGSPMGGYDVVVCRDCGFGFADNIPDQATLDRYYREMSKYENRHRGGEVSETSLATYKSIVDSVKPFLKSKEARVADIGCATGRLLALLREDGYVNVTGIDPSPACAETAATLYGIHVLTHALTDLPASEHHYDFLILSSVLEHIVDVDTAVSKMRHLLSQEGMIFVEVPDVTRFAQWVSAPFQQFSIEHVNFFSPGSLANLMQAKGFTQVVSRRNVRASTDPAVSAIFRKGNTYSREPGRDSETESALLEYVRASRKVDDGVREALRKVAENRQPIIVWGVGTHTQRLLAEGALAKINIRAFVDSNPRYHGKRVNGIRVLAPTELKDRPEAILISSKDFQQEIVTQIRHEFKYPNDLIILYHL